MRSKSLQKQSRRSGISVCIVFMLLTFMIIPGQIYAENVIKMGAAVSLTGALSREGNYCKDSYEYWREYVNNDLGGITVGGKKYEIDIKYYDDQSIAATGRFIGEKWKTVQIQGDKIVLVSPPDVAFKPLIYPSPTWDKR